MTEIDRVEDGCWIHVTAPTEQEIAALEHSVAVDPDYIRAALDEEEVSRVESDNGQTLIVIDFSVREMIVPPKKKKQTPSFNFYTLPMAVILLSNCIITVSLAQNPIMEDFARGSVKGVNTAFRTQFLFLILLRIAAAFLQHLKHIDKLSSGIESEMRKSSRNEELFQLSDLRKSLVYFSTSLKANEKVIGILMRKKVVRFYDEDQELLDDVLVEVKQAVEMGEIHTHILASTLESFTGVISNNLNIVMKALAVITIVVEIPNLVFGFYGMNVSELPFTGTPAVAIVGSVGLCLLASVLLTKFKFYK
jgi:magnesium transporter